MKKKIAIAILVIASYVGIALFVNSIITEKTTENEKKLVEQTEKFEEQVLKTVKLEEKTIDYLKYSITDDCIYVAGEEERSYCQCTVNFLAENNDVISLMNMDMGFDDESLDDATDRAYEKCMYLAL